VKRARHRRGPFHLLVASAGLEDAAVPVPGYTVTVEDRDALAARQHLAVGNECAWWSGPAGHRRWSGRRPGVKRRRRSWQGESGSRTNCNPQELDASHVNPFVVDDEHIAGRAGRCQWRAASGAGEAAQRGADQNRLDRGKRPRYRNATEQAPRSQLAPHPPRTTDISALSLGRSRAFA